MKKKRKLLIILVCIVVLCVILFCACRRENDLFKAASPTTSALRFVYHDESTGFSAWLYDAAKEQQIITDLSQVKAVPVNNWTPELVTWPVYGISISGFNADGVDAAWSNGYLILQDGSVYKFDYDFSKLKGSYEWEDVTESAYLPSRYYLARNDGQWYSKFLTPAEHEPAPENISLTVTAVEDGRVSATITNEGSKEWTYGEAFSLEVLLDGVWYSVPTVPAGNWGFVSIGYILPGGEAREESYSLTMYGDLPSGTYRLVVEGLTAEFIL